MSTEQILSEALCLSRQSRALIAEKLLVSLDLGDDFTVSEEWRKEIRSRCDELDRGDVELVPGEQVFDDVSKALGCDS